MKSKNRLLDLLGSALIAVLFSISLTLVLAEALMLAAPIWLILLCGGLAAIVCAGFAYNRPIRLATTIAVVIGIIASYAVDTRLFGNVIELIAQVWNPAPDVAVIVSAHSETISCIVAILFCIAFFLMTRMPGGIYPALCLTLILLLSSWLLSKQLNFWHTLPALIALAAMFARSYEHKTSYFKALPMALVAALLATLLVPAGHPTFQPLEEAAERMRQRFYDYFMFTDPRTAYSISSDGFQPNGNSLGGPADPDERDVMMVKTDVPLMLRGSIRRTYTGYSWEDSAYNSRYVFTDPIKRSARNTVFGIDLPSGDMIFQLQAQDLWPISEVDAHVTMLNPGTSTLFVPHRLQDLSLEMDSVAYYNNNGEVFITRSVEDGDAYGLSAQVINNMDTQKLDALLAYCAQLSDGEFADVQSNYTALPSGVESGVYKLTEEIVANANTPFQKAQLIMEHFRSDRYSYTLDVDYPPQNRDFVSYFLLESKEGYCSYFASSMAVMARIAGLPSRYVEGYILPNAQNGNVIVTGKNAHAWVEIYFEGFGWMTFDPTPGNEADDPIEDPVPPEDGSADNESDPPEETEDSSDGAEEDDFQNEEEDNDSLYNEDPTPEPEDEMNDEGSEDEDPTREPPEGDLNDPNTDDTPPPPNSWWNIALTTLLVLCMLGVFAFWIAHRIQKTRPAQAAAQLESDKDRLLLWYRAILQVLSQQGQTPAGGETPFQFVQRLISSGIAPQALKALVQTLTESQYANKPPSLEAFEAANLVYKQLAQQLKPIERLRWLWQRLVHGLGTIQNIP